MTPEMLTTWTTALRSNKYKQGRIRLRNISDEFCCLGVLCDINGENWTPEGNHYRINNENTCVLTKRLQDKFGLSLDQENHLIKLNDDCKLNFHQIADFIESKEFENLK